MLMENNKEFLKGMLYGAVIVLAFVGIRAINT